MRQFLSYCCLLLCSIFFIGQSIHANPILDGEQAVPQGIQKEYIDQQFNELKQLYQKELGKATRKIEQNNSNIVKNLETSIKEQIESLQGISSQLNDFKNSSEEQNNSLLANSNELKNINESSFESLSAENSTFETNIMYGFIALIIFSLSILIGLVYLIRKLKSLSPVNAEELIAVKTELQTNGQQLEVKINTLMLGLAEMLKEAQQLEQQRLEQLEKENLDLRKEQIEIEKTSLEMLEMTLNKFTKRQSSLKTKKKLSSELPNTSIDKSIVHMKFEPGNLKKVD